MAKTEIYHYILNQEMNITGADGSNIIIPEGSKVRSKQVTGDRPYLKSLPTLVGISVTSYPEQVRSMLENEKLLDIGRESGVYLAIWSVIKKSLLEGESLETEE